MNVLATYYYVCAGYLEKYLPYIPELKLTNARGYYGRISKDENEVFIIYLSKCVVSFGMINENNIEELIDTICHELAHMLFWDHGEEHFNLTKKFKNIIKTKVNIKDVNKELDFINKRLEMI